MTSDAGLRQVHDRPPRKASRIDVNGPKGARVGRIGHRHGDTRTPLGSFRKARLNGPTVGVRWKPEVVAAGAEQEVLCHPPTLGPRGRVRGVGGPGSLSAAPTSTRQSLSSLSGVFSTEPVTAPEPGAAL